MPNDDPTPGEIVRRLDRIDEALQQLPTRVVGAELYARDRAESERRFAEVDRDIAAERQDRRDADRQLDAELEAERQARYAGDKELREKSSTNWRQALFQGAPIVLALAAIAVTLILATRGVK